MLDSALIRNHASIFTLFSVERNLNKRLFTIIKISKHINIILPLIYGAGSLEAL